MLPFYALTEAFSVVTLAYAIIWSAISAAIYAAVSSLRLGKTLLATGNFVVPRLGRLCDQIPQRSEITRGANSRPSSPLDKRGKVRFNTLLGWRCIVAPSVGMRVSSVVSFSRSNFRPAPDAAHFSLRD